MHSISLQHTATHCNTLQHFATHCNATFLGLRSMCIFMSVNIYICIHVIYSHTKFPYDRYQAGHRLPQIAHMPLCVHMYMYVYMNICHILIDWISISTISSWLPRIAPACTYIHMDLSSKYALVYPNIWQYVKLVTAFHGLQLLKITGLFCRI